MKVWPDLRKGTGAAVKFFSQGVRILWGHGFSRRPRAQSPTVKRAKRLWGREWVVTLHQYSRFPITRTFKGNRKRFELSGVRVIESSKKIAGSKEKKQFLLHNEHFNHI